MDTCQGKLLTGSGVSPRKSVLQSTKLKVVGDLEYVDIKHEDVGFGVCSAGFWSFFCLVFSNYAPFHPCQNGNVYPMLNVSDMRFHFDFTGATVNRLS